MPLKRDDPLPQMTPDLYADFAQRYDLAFGAFGEHDPLTLEFFRRLFSQHGVRTVLDCACGTGRHLHMFHGLGCQVVGSDLSAAMLAQAAENLAAHGLQIPLHQLDYRELPQGISMRFDAVVCLGSIGYMADEAEFLRAFESMCGVLQEGGLLVLTAMPTDSQWQQKPRFLLTSNTRDFSRVFVIDYLEDRARYNILDIFHTEQVRDFKVWSAELHVLLRDDQERLLKQAGFQRVDFYGSFEFEAYDKETSDKLITVAQR